ncbi:MAG TPA: M3 family oligoendopeptidase [Acidimicrobiales bacterium]|nr:M3 family oligoendopeptidase [Acidimicrobiales bacterium]
MTATEAPTDRLPHWDLTDVFPSIGSREYAGAREELGADLTRLTALYDDHDVRGGDDRRVDDATVAAFERVLDETNAVMERSRLLGAYLNSFVSTDARDDSAQGELSRLQAELSQLARLRGRFDAWVAALGDAELTARSTAAADHAYPLERSTLRAAHQMSEPEEGLLADLSLTGSTAWVRLYGTYTSQLVVRVERPDGTTDAMPMSRARGLAYDADPTVRRSAYEAELATWQAGDVPIIAALNAIKGEAATVNRRRGWADDLEPALVANGVDRPTLEAMQSAVEAALPDFRRYLRTKARLLGQDEGAGLPFFDLFAPLGDGRARRWDEATEAVTTTFATYSPELRRLAERAVDDRWIDAEPRDGKRDGAFCMGVADDRSAVLLNFDGSFRSVQTLAHELGHAYHNVTLAQRTPLQRQLPMALAETASIFCETIMVQHGLATAAPDERLALIEGDLQSACQVVVDIHSRFLFERSFCEARATGTVSSAEACQLMADAQRASYGDGLSIGHPYMWAAKPHYYSSAFYNWPYTFGLLFGLGLYARYAEDPDRFRGGYDDLLSSCGLASAADLAARFGIDVRDRAFWEASLRVLQERIDEFVALANG